MNSKPLTVFETPWFRIERALETVNGDPYYVLRAPDAVVVFALTHDERIILIRQNRIARGGPTLECPAGAIEPGETPREAALRELREETGFEAGEIFALGRGGLGLDRDTAVMHGFVVFGAKRPAGAVPEPGIEVVLVTMSEFQNIVREGRFEQLAALGVAFNAFLCFKERLSGMLPDEIT